MQVQNTLFPQKCSQTAFCLKYGDAREGVFVVEPIWRSNCVEFKLLKMAPTIMIMLSRLALNF